jgi:hypothetical protein
MSTTPCEKRLANEQRMHTEAFSALVMAFDRQAEELAREQGVRAAAERRVFGLKSRLWFARTPPLPAPMGANGPSGLGWAP